MKRLYVGVNRDSYPVDAACFEGNRYCFTKLALSGKALLHAHYLYFPLEMYCDWGTGEYVSVYSGPSLYSVNQFWTHHCIGKTLHCIFGNSFLES